MNLVIGGNPISANPTPGTTIALAGVGSVVLNKVTITGNNAKSKNITVDMLTIEVAPGNLVGLPLGAKIVVAHATSGFVRNVLPAFVGGQAYAAAANSTVGSVIQNKIGKAALVTIGCDGTGGVTKTNNIEAINASPVLSIGTGVTTAFGGIDGSGTIARTTAKIENAGLIKVPVLGALVHFTAITVVAEDKYNGSLHTRSTAGTQFTGLKIAGVNLPINVAPNFRVDVPLFGYVIVNEQTIPAADKKGIMVVNGLKIVIETATAGPSGRQPDRRGARRGHRAALTFRPVFAADCGSRAIEARPFLRPLDPVQPAIFAVMVDQRRRLLDPGRGLDLADEDRVGAGRRDLDQPAFEDRGRGGQHRHAGPPDPPIADRESAGTMAFVATAEMLGEMLLGRRQHVDREFLAFQDQTVCVRVTMDAGEQARWLGGKRADRGRGQAGAALAQAAGHDRDATGEPAHPGNEVGGGDRQDDRAPGVPAFARPRGSRS